MALSSKKNGQNDINQQENQSMMKESPLQVSLQHWQSDRPPENHDIAVVRCPNPSAGPPSLNDRGEKEIHELPCLMDSKIGRDVRETRFVDSESVIVESAHH